MLSPNQNTYILFLLRFFFLRTAITTNIREQVQEEAHMIIASDTWLGIEFKASYLLSMYFNICA